MQKYIFIFIFFISQTFFAQQDCITAVPICSDADISMTPNGSGTVTEAGSGGCLSGESNSFWFTFSIQTPGTLTFLVTPTGPGANNIDYDFALYGPSHDCANVNAPPLRCSFASLGTSITPPLTGLSLTATDTSEGAGGNGFVKYIDVTPGEVYYLLLNNFSTDVAPFSLTFGGTATLLTPFDYNSSKIYQPYPFLEPGQNGEIDICGNPINFDFSTLTSHIINGNSNFIVKYYRSGADAMEDINPITTPISVNTTTDYSYAISYVDPNSPTSFLNQCREFGTIKFKDRSFRLSPATLTECSNNNTGTALYNLTTASINADPSYTLQYYPSLAAANNGIDEILNPYTYTSPAGSVYVKATNQYGCTDIVEIKLNFFPTVTVTDATLRSCFIETNPSTALFNLTTAPVNSQNNMTKKYYPSLADAVDGTNEIMTPATYIAPNGVAYVKVINTNGCYSVAKVTLIVLPPIYSNVLEDKIICIENKATLDAGPGFNAYEWSTGETTQSISNVGVGTYWVKLKTGECFTTQTVKVYPAEQPVISNIEIATNTVTVYVVGGTPPYKYSMDNINWQDSNVFKNVPRGDSKVYVKDAYDCDPIEINIVVPNLINVITPNGDGINDVIDYSALSGKQSLTFTVFDRYGSQLFQADKSNSYKWDGTVGGKKIPTGTYWYSITWNENNKKNTPFKFSGWIMVKNRD
ncbi:gliding motility-associated C-terminal domain-containing protein [Chryseobacterium nematophagum]|uniref:Gliding motility-associated C-terminal domain-containing protein n=1 Tax=Chryseobacterium nematophagum TaxID=2305228 RepID=A0A3M7TD60_9FLAO|nr:T9SS type B sorting domain-containing protein [Chryseobacterium nematophagum]RNA60807.1 gliding motility-associated C-terminal domain-containing protein [Chryseobacterium nematophagum]